MSEPRYKKYILFQWDSNDSAGGLGDIRGSFDTLDEARDHARVEHFDFNEVVDRDAWEVVWRAR